MEETANKLNALTSLYNNVLNDILFYQNNADNANIADIIAVVIIPFLNVFNVDGFIISIISVLVPCLQFISLQRGLQNHTFVAILRGYSASLEEEINKLINQEIFIYNSRLIDKYIASQKVVNSKGLKHSILSTALIHYMLLIVCVCFFLYYNNINNIYVMIGVMAWYTLCFYYITKLCISFKKKEQKRYESKDFAKSLFDSDN